MATTVHRRPAEGGQSRIATAQAALSLEVDRLISGEDWCRYLALQARLHSYSFGNVLLIGAQHREAFTEGRVTGPEPSMVAGFRTWQALGRSVSRGQRGYAILAPIRLRVEDSSVKDNTSPAVEVTGLTPPERRVLRFRLAHVFDVSQTTGAELPLPPNLQLLIGAAPAGLEVCVRRLIEAEGFTVSPVPDAAAIGGANGQTDWSSRRVVIRGDMDEAARVKTLLHEAGHVLLHGDPAGRALPRAVKEVEAESVAFVVASVHGMESGSYSFPYVAGWAGADAARTVAATGTRVAAAAKKVVAATTPAPTSTRSASRSQVPGRVPTVAATAAIGDYEIGL
jgi:hypothetical protein